MTRLPTGTVTFLLSDIEGSTRLWAERPEGMASAVTDSYAILDRAIARHHGVRPVEQGEGDSVVGAFSRASDAVAAAVEAQRDFHEHAWPGRLELRVRIALHTAEAQLRDDGNYFGLALSRCARLRALAHGGQTLISGATRDLVVDRLPEGAELVDCGIHRLRDLGRPEHVFALVHPASGHQPGPLRSPGAFPNNLPDQLTSFVGRARELDELRAALAETRLLTVTGPGGAGKTRLALQIAADPYEGGAWWVDLAPVADPRLVDEVLASALDVRPLPAMTALQASCVHLAGSRALVVLDNCEHLLAACAEVTEILLRACPGVTVLATSRTPLGVAGETDWRIPPLEPSEAARLFVERARKARPSLAVSDAVSKVCQELDGLPLAIELAAARVRMMSVEQIAAGLGDRFHLLTGGTRSALARHQTLRASVDWSHELLSERERTLLRRLGVFAGGFTLELAEAACAGEPLERPAILDLLASLVDKSLVVAEERQLVVRYRLLETVRQYALERLDEACEADAISDRHRDALLAVAERIAPELHGPSQREWLDAFDQESANFAAALDRAARTDAERALRLCVAATFWWKGRGLFEPAERGFATALDAGDPAPSALRAHALWGRGYLAAYAGRFEAALGGLQQAYALAEQVGDQSVLARSLMAIGFLQMFADPIGANSTNQSARDLARACGDDWALITASLNVAFTHLVRHELDETERLLDETLPLSERHGYLEMQAWHWVHKCFRSWLATDAAQLSDYATRALAFADAAGEPTTAAIAHGYLAHLELLRGRPEAALDAMRSTYARVIAAGAGFALGYTVTWLALAQAGLGDVRGASALLEEAVSTGIDHGFALGHATVNLAGILRLAGEPAAAEARAADALAIGERIGGPVVIGWAKAVLGRLAGDRADWGRAELLLHESLAGGSISGCSCGYRRRLTPSPSSPPASTATRRPPARSGSPTARAATSASSGGRPMPPASHGSSRRSARRSATMPTRSPTARAATCRWETP